MKIREQFKVLIADDEGSLRSLLREILQDIGLQRIQEAANGEDALQMLRKEPFDLLFLDIKMPKRDGLSVLREMSGKEWMPRTVVLTAFGDFSIALEATKLGAFDYINKPFNIEEIKKQAEKALHLQELEEEVKVVRSELSEKDLGERIVGRSEKMLEIIKTVGRIANSSVTILVMGESGTGKELVARTIHRASGRAAGPFMPVNCAAIPEPLLESELFGYEKGAFTGAGARTVGKFEATKGGTIFLDEIGDMTLNLQAKLLRVLQDHTFMRVGGTESVQVDVRVIAATNQEIETMVKENRFREDLFYRLNVLKLQIPPLRERREDIKDLALYFMAKSAKECGKMVRGFSNESLDLLWGYSWPGNVRELENSIARAVAKTASSILTLEDFDLPKETVTQETIPLVPLAQATAEVEKKLIQQALTACDGNQTQAAKLLQISRQTLASKIKGYGIQT
jgi:two-component system response regulator AtoC